MHFQQSSDEAWDNLWSIGGKPQLIDCSSTAYHGGSRGEAEKIETARPQDRFMVTESQLGPGVYFSQRTFEARGARFEQSHEDAYRGAEVLAKRNKGVPPQECVVVQVRIAAERCYDVLAPENADFFRLAHSAAVQEQMSYGTGNEKHVFLTAVLGRVLKFYGPKMSIQTMRSVLQSKDTSRPPSTAAGPIYCMVVLDVNCVDAPAVVPAKQTSEHQPAL